jgi:WhiB family transcriptional regulator, redox-sensing transcriptional regulator
VPRGPVGARTGRDTPHRYPRTVPDPASALIAWLMTPGSGEQLPGVDDLAHRPTWMKRAQCRGVGRDLFFPEHGGNGTRARRICSSCPVRQDCLDYALANPEMAGVWGGTTERERQKMRAAA